MGADLVLATIEIKESKEDSLARLERLKIDESFLSRFENCGYFFWEDSEFSPEIAKEMKERLQTAIEVVYSVYHGGGSRDCNTLLVDSNRDFVITGGQTWGDDPSAEFVDFCIFQEFLAYPFWCSPDSDYAKEWHSNKVVA